MSHGYQRGFIGTKEIELAIIKLESLSWKKDENLFINAKMNSEIISCYWYKDLEDLLDDNEYLDTFLNIEDYKAQMLEIDEDFKYDEKDEDEELINIFRDNKTAYKSSCGNSGVYFYDDDKDFAIKELIGKDKECSYYTYEEAMGNLKGDFKYLDENLVIGLLS
jgi:hypothetical protein